MQAIDDYLKMGFTKAQIQKAQDLWKSQRNVDFMDVLLRSQPSSSSPVKSNSQILKDYAFDVIAPDQRIRQNKMPAGLKNMANVCYLNSLIQTYFHNPVFVKEILKFNYPLSLSFEKLINKNEAKAKRIKSSINLVVHLQRLFAYLVHTNRKYVDPFAVFLNVVDEFGNGFQLGDQKDLAEFNLQFIFCIDEGLKYDENKVVNAEVQATESNPLLQRPMSIILLDEACVDCNSPLQSQSQSQILHNSKSIISGLFFGKTKEFIRYKINEQAHESEENEQIFLQIILNVAYKDLYNAWEAQNSFGIENYKTHNETIMYAEKNIWITQIPDSLLFQIQRVGYEPSSGLIKLNDEFRFEKEIYADRFLLENKQVVQQSQQQFVQLKQRKQQLQQQIMGYTNYQNSNQSMLSILENSLKYIQEHCNDEKVVTALSSTKLAIQNKLNRLQQEIDEVNQEIDSMYAILRKHKYCLQSILIHEGAAESGHYYAYIYNTLLKQWFKFNDINVMAVSEEKVLKDAYGDGKQKMNAYCLIYLSAEIANQPTLFPNYNRESAYNQFIQPNLKIEVENDNNKFMKELQEFELVELGDLVMELYNSQFQQVNEAHRRYKLSKSVKPLVTSFPVFLRYELDNNNDLVKWAILDGCIREASQDKYSIRDTLNHQLLFQRIKYHFEQLGPFKSPSKVVIDKQILKHLRHYYEVYIQKLQVTSARQYLITTTELNDI